MGNYISIIIGCVGAVELITFLHQFSLRADEEHDRELEQESSVSGIVTVAVDQIPSNESRVDNQKSPLKPQNEKSPELQRMERGDDNPPEVVEEVYNKVKVEVTDREPPARSTERPPEIRFELYERSCSLSDVDRPLVDGLKLQRPLVRDDGSGRRKSIRKRNSSGSIDTMKACREEELRMFTSLEEEEFSSLSEGGFRPISYGSPNADSSSSVKVTRRHRRFKRSPVKDSQNITSEESASSSHEVLNDVPLLDDPEDVTYPWGDINPKLRKKHMMHEKSMSIEELQEDDEERTTVDEVTAAGCAVVDVVAIEKVAIGGGGGEVGGHQPAPSSAAFIAGSGEQTIEDRSTACGRNEREDEEPCVSSCIVVSIESEPNIDRFARLNLHDEDGDADDDMTPMPLDQQQLPFQYQKLRESPRIIIEEVADDELEGEEEEDDEERHQQETEVDVDDEESTLRAEDTLEDLSIGLDELLSQVDSTQEDAKSDSASDVRTWSPDRGNEIDLISVDGEIEESDHLEVYEEEAMEEPKIDALANSELEQSDLKESGIEEIIAPIEEFECVAKEIRVIQIEVPLAAEMAEEFEIEESEINIEQALLSIPETDVPRNTPAEEINSFLESERLDQTHLSTDQSISEVKESASKDGPRSGLTEMEEDISNYNDFVTIMQSNVMKEARKGFHFPLDPEKKDGCFPKTMSNLITFDDEDITDNEKKNLGMRKRENSIKTKIVTENTNLFKTTGHHRRYNMPSHSIDMGTRLELSNKLMLEEKKVFPRNRQIFIPGNFPRNILSEKEYNLKQEDGPGPDPVRVKRITYTQPIVQLTMIREEMPTSSSGTTTSLPTQTPFPAASQSVPATPQNLFPSSIDPIRRSRSVSPYIVDREDPMMELLRDSMEIPLVYNTED